jgi:hypothetical protein
MKAVRSESTCPHVLRFLPTQVNFKLVSTPTYKRSGRALGKSNGACEAIQQQTYHCIRFALLKPEQYPNPMHEGVCRATAQVQSHYNLRHLHCTKIEEWELMGV